MFLFYKKSYKLFDPLRYFLILVRNWPSKKHRIYNNKMNVLNFIIIETEEATLKEFVNLSWIRNVLRLLLHCLNLKLLADRPQWKGFHRSRCTSKECGPHDCTKGSNRNSCCNVLWPPSTIDSSAGSNMCKQTFYDYAINF